ncbi:MAG: flagellar biosynthesis protein FlgH [Bdellovibrio sp.]|nr:MAG: flagellar biosynthesis protein FlgH [Bdellovibrio sp.]
MRILLCCFLLFAQVGCASFGKKLKAFLNGQAALPQLPKGLEGDKKATEIPGPSFSKMPNYRYGLKRQYKRMTRKKLEEESMLDSRAGSLWVMEGQGAYLFSQNIMRLIGDPITIKMDGDPKEQMEAKAQVIAKLLKKYEQLKQEALARSLAANAPKKGSRKVVAPKPKSPSEKPAGEEKDKKAFTVKNIPARIVERTVDGNYRIKGSQVFLIGKKEYKAIVTGVVRAEDFSEDGISASKLIDPRFDIVSVKRRKE